MRVTVIPVVVDALGTVAKVRKRVGGIGNLMANRDQPNNNNVKIG